MRVEFVSRAAEDTSVRAEVLELLRHHHDGEHPDAPDAGQAPPDRIGPYRILGLLGRGGMGLVYRAERDGGEHVALKVLEAGVLAGRFISRFRRETEALRRLDHPGIARFLESGTYDSVVGPRPYYAMELVEGESLRQKAKDPAWRERDRIALLADLGEALHHAHEHGIVHRDLKPENVVVTAAGRPKVLDFGVARITADDLRGGTLATLTGEFLGTVRYMSPEQAQGLSDEVDRRSDVYALGVLAYELLSGVLPYELHTRSVTRALVQVATAAARPLGEIRPTLRGPIERIVARTLQKRPGDRYPTAAELAADLRRYLAGERVHAPAPPLATRALRMVRRRPRASGAAGLAALAMFVLATRGFWPGAEPPAAAADAATARACALLDSVDTRLHHGPRTMVSLERAEALLGKANAEIRGVGRRDYVADLRRYAAWREGEAHFFRASLEGDPDEFLRAAEAWTRARGPIRPFPLAIALPDTTVPIYPRLTRGRAHQVDVAIAIAYGEVARDRQPARFSRLALQHVRAAWDVFARTEGVDPDPLRAVTAPSLAGIRARLLNDFGASVSAVAFYEDSVRLLDDGLGLLGRAADAGGLGDDPGAAASLLHNLGQAWLWRGRMRREPAALDSAIRQLEQALAVRAILPGSTSVLETRAALAEALRLRARLEPGPAGPGPWIGRAERIVTEGLGGREAEGGAIPRARLAIEQAATLTDAAIVARDATALTRAESLLATLQSLFPRDRYPVAYARFEREAGRAEAARWLLTGSEGARVEALARFSAAVDALTLSHHRSFRLECEAATRWLGARVAGTPALSEPGFWP